MHEEGKGSDLIWWGSPLSNVGLEGQGLLPRFLPIKMYEIYIEQFSLVECNFYKNNKNIKVTVTAKFDCHSKDVTNAETATN